MSRKVNEIVSEGIAKKLSLTGGDGFHMHPPADKTRNGFMTVEDRLFLNTIEEGAQKNQNAFSTVNNVSAKNPEDTLNVVGGVGITISTNPSDNKVTITATGQSTPGPHGISHNNDGPDPIPDLVAATAQLADIMINVKLFGAIGDGVTDDTLAIQSGIDEAVSKKGTLYLPPGVYKYTNVLNAVGSNFGIRGAGKGKTILITSTDGLNIQGDLVSLEGFTLQTTESSKHGITITGNYHSIKDISLQGVDLANDYWDKGIYCINLWYSELSGIDVFGGTQGVLRQGYGVYADYSVNNKVNKCNFNSVDIGIHLSNAPHPVENFRCEGWNIRDSIFIVSNYGVYALSGLHVSINECVIDIIHNKGIYMEVGGSCSIANNWIAAANEDSNFIGIHIKTGEKVIVTSNNISSKNALGVGIKVESSYNIITANTLFSTNIGVLIENQFNTITNNSVNGMGSYAIRIASANCVVSSNYIDNSRIFADPHNWSQFDKWTTTVVVALTGGATQNIDVPIAEGAFSSVPVIGFLQSASAGARVSAYYDVDNPATTKTNARFVVYMPNGSNLPTTTARFSAFLANADFFI